ncbi:DUF2798 domain-containing protein [Lacibacterium aquatile]|uniref:DUF2798 domain-containing protein n=1 Tax=Lacibacterium aquatile TaxID=1168082 RepID=A0ABW5DXQ1_9PROT
MRPFIPKRYEAYAFGFLLSGMMSAVVSLIATLRAVGLTAEVPHLWLTSWPIAWAVAFPTVLVVAPTVRKILARIVRQS